MVRPATCGSGEGRADWRLVAPNQVGLGSGPLSRIRADGSKSAEPQRRSGLSPARADLAERADSNSFRCIWLTSGGRRRRSERSGCAACEQVAGSEPAAERLHLDSLGGMPPSTTSISLMGPRFDYLLPADRGRAGSVHKLLPWRRKAHFRHAMSTWQLAAKVSPGRFAARLWRGSCK